MSFRWITAGLLALAPAVASAFETVDALPFPSSGAFPAWQPDGRAVPWSIYAYGGLMYDSNAFRRDSGEESDIVSRVGVGGRASARVIGRQRVAVEAFGEYYDYDQFSEIDHFGYGLRGEWLWEIGNTLDGNIGYTRRRRHADLGEFQVERRVMGTTQQWFADGGWRFHPDWRLFGALEHSKTERDTDVLSEIDSTTARTALTYRTGLGNVVGVEARATRGETPIREDLGAVANVFDYDERELAATLAYAVGTTLRLTARLGNTTREYEELPERNFDDVTWRAGADWAVVPKIVLRFATFHAPAPATDFDSLGVVRTGNLFGASWAPTFKLVFTATFTHERRVNEGDPVTAVLDLPPRDDTVRVWRFGAGWEPQRHWQVGAAVDVGERTSNVVGREYDYVQVMGNLRWTF
jgi:hypothetical protein